MNETLLLQNQLTMLYALHNMTENELDQHELTKQIAHTITALNKVEIGSCSHTVRGPSPDTDAARNVAPPFTFGGQ